MVQTPFADRAHAGDLLAHALKPLVLVDPVVLALPRGGVPVAAVVARELRAPLDLLMAREIDAPGPAAQAVAAVVEMDHPDVVTDEQALRASGLGHDYVVRQAAGELREIERLRSLYLRDRAPLPLAGKTVVLVDDGIASGATVRAAIKALRHASVARLVLAVPVAPAAKVAELRAEVDDLVCLLQPEAFLSIGAFYDDFHRVRDDEIIKLMDMARERLPFAATS